MAATVGPRTVAIMPGVVNRTDNKSLRFAMLKYGLERFCQEMTRRGAPLRFRDDQPAAGRYFPQRCDSRILDDETQKSLFLQFFGTGYFWSNITKRFGFEAAGALQYDPDFLMDDSTMYVYFRARSVGSTAFKVLMIENPTTGAIVGATPMEALANRIGQQVVASELAKGFTLIRDPDGSVDFGLGLVERGRRPFHPYEVRGSDKVVLGNERTEVHSGQREFLGPYEVDSDGRALWILLEVDGIDAVDVMVFARDGGEPWLATYVRQSATTPPPYPPLMTEIVHGRTTWRKSLPIAKGVYYVVVDNTATAGSVAPPPNPLDDRAALVSYLVQLGDAP